MNNVIIWGATGQSIVLHELLSRKGQKIIAYFDNNKEVVSPIGDIPIFYGERGFNKWLLSNTNIDEIGFIVAIGGTNGKVREQIFDYLKSKNINGETAIHDSAYVADNAVVGEGSQVLVGSTICARAIIGRSVIINTASSIDHETIIGNFVHIAPGATLCGCVEVGDYSFIGANSTILPRIKIGINSVVGAGSVVTRDVPDNTVVYGNPARIRQRTSLHK
jgi:sugar O-acyltransferase (sialic acid O-acetyltransferase NeuD family)